MRSFSYHEGQTILEIVISNICLIHLENVLKGAMQDISNAYIHPNHVRITFSSDSDEIHLDYG